MSVVPQIVIFLFVLVSVNCKISPSVLKEIIREVENDKLVSCKDKLISQVNFKPHLQFKNNKTSEVFCKAFKALHYETTCKNIHKKKLLINLQTAAGQIHSCSIDKTAEFELSEFLKGLKLFTKYVFKEMEWNRI